MLQSKNHYILWVAWGVMNLIFFFLFLFLFVFLSFLIIFFYIIYKCDVFDKMDEQWGWKWIQNLLISYDHKPNLN